MNLLGFNTGSLCWEVEVKERLSFVNIFFLLLCVLPLLSSLTQEPIKITSHRSISLPAGSPLNLKISDFFVNGVNAANYPEQFSLEVYPGHNYSNDGTTIFPASGFTGDISVLVRIGSGGSFSQVYKLPVSVAAPAGNIVARSSDDHNGNGNGGGNGNGNGGGNGNGNGGGNGNGNGGANGNGNGGGNGNGNGGGNGNGNGGGNGNGDGDGGGNGNGNDGSTDGGSEENTAPVISAQSSVSTEEGQAFTIEFSYLTVTDPDDNYPEGFTMTVGTGASYSVNGRTVTPAAGFSGTLVIPVTVNDGEANSNEFSFNLTVNAKAPVNVKPDITGQTALTTQEGQAITIDFANLSVTDPDNTYPTGFTMSLSPGDNYSVSGTTVTPAAGFSGTLTVPVVVNDGQANSDPFNLSISVTAAPVENARPSITGQTALTTQEGTPITIEFNNLTVSDPDDTYPTGFTMTVSPGTNYSVSGRTVTPNAGFTGNVTVPVTVNDGDKSSDPFNVTISVTAKPVENAAPVISGQAALSTEQGKPLTIQLSDLTVTDPDDTYPQGFTLTISPGANYTVSGTTITPAEGFTGQLTVPVVVNDGQVNSAPFNLAVTVRPLPVQNTKPVIVGQVPVSILNNQTHTLALSQLVVTDPDNTFPDDFTLTVLPGANYSVSGNIVTPAPGFTGILVVKVKVSDGKGESDVYEFQINVQPAASNTRPVITGQQELTTFRNEPVVLSLNNLIVSDPDNNYPADFSLAVLPGTNYTASGTTVTPAPGFLGSLTVQVTVSDGTSVSQPFNLRINVADRAQLQISGQQQIAISEDQSYELKAADLLVNDPNGQYPSGFTLRISAGANYTVEGNKITPAADFNGSLTVPVQVTNGTATSNSFNLVIIVRPVNDAPVFTEFDSTTVYTFSPGGAPVPLAREINIEDADNEQLAYAEVQIFPEDFSFGLDQLLMESTAEIRGVFDPNAGTLILLGIASVDAYTNALRTIRFTTLDSVSADRTIRISFRLNDGLAFSDAYTKTVQFSEAIVLDIPTVFTPNDDNANDTWNIASSNSGDAASTLIRVFDKRGLMVFESFSLGTAWDGKYRGQVLPPDSYFFIIEVQSGIGTISKKGTVTILY